MANPPGIDPSFWEDYRKRYEAELEQVRKDLAPLETGEMRLGARTGEGPWRDITQDWIAHHKQTIAKYEAILAALEKRQLL